ncbi:MAG: hypothetical protein ABIG68_02150, partial [Acidobacteriota bacterium]
VSLTGFKTLVQDPLPVAIGVTSTYSAVLDVGQIEQEVVVEAGLAAVNTTDATLGNVISGVQVQNLPTESLDPAGLLSLQPGVTFVPGKADAVGGYSNIIDQDGRGGSVNGARSDQTNITLDGVDVNDPQNGYAFTSALRATQASLQEFRVTTSSYNADLGRSSGAQIQLVTKSGSNEIHGEAYYAHRNEAFAANDFFSNQDGVEKGKLRRHIYGFAMGGPLIKDRLFLFGNFERLEHIEESGVLRTVPSEAFRDGVLFYRCANESLCPGGSVRGYSNTHSVPQGFHGLTPAQAAAIDPLGIGPSPAIISYAKQYPMPNTTSGVGDGYNRVGFRFNAPVNNDFKTYIARMDFNIDPQGNHTVYARGTLQDDAVVSAVAQYPGLPPNQTMLGNSRGLALGYKAILSPTLLSNVRYGYTRIGEQFAGVQTSEFVNLRFLDDLNGFDGTSSSRGRIFPQHHIRNDWSLVKGTHTLGLGVEFRFTRNTRFSNANSFHIYSGNPSWVPGVGRGLAPGQLQCTTPGCSAVPAVSSGFVSAYRDTAITMYGLITQVSAYYNFRRDGSVLATGEPVGRRFATNEYELYIQDQWRLKPNLTLTYGLRWGLGTPPWETNGDQVIPSPNLSEWFESRRTLMLNGLPTNMAAPLSFTLAGKANDGRPYYAYDWNNFSPRVSVAWSPKITGGWLGRITGGDKLVFRGGYSIVYDRIGNGLVTSFDNFGSFGMSTNIDSTFGGCDEGYGRGPLGTCPRYSGAMNTAAARAQMLPPAPPGGFPAFPPGANPDGSLQDGAFAIAQALDSGITTPYAHVINFSIARELPGNFSVEASYVGRRGRDQLIARDMAMPADLCDPASGQCYFKAAQELIGMFEKGVNIKDIKPMPFFEKFFPGWGPNGINGGVLPYELVPGATSAGGYSATQVAYDLVNGDHPDSTVTPWVLDNYAYPSYATCASGTDLDGDGIKDCPFTIFDDQFATLNALSSIARSEYHAFQLTVRRRFAQGWAFDLNYSLSHSLDHSSQAERAGVAAGDTFTGGYTGSTINAWQPDLEYATSDFDMRHQFNANWSLELPFGHGKPLGGNVPGWFNQIIGGWMVSGIFRANSGLPANVINARVWPTNWNLQGNATCSPVVDDPTHSVQVGPCPATQNVKNAVDATGAGRGPNLFANPDQAFKNFRYTLPGDRGERNVLRADKYINLDLAIGKKFRMPFEGHSLQFRWEMFNATNSAFFDSQNTVWSIGAQGTFGDYTSLMGGPRRMQVSLRYTF